MFNNFCSVCVIILFISATMVEACIQNPAFNAVCNQCNKPNVKSIFRAGCNICFCEDGKAEPCIQRLCTHPNGCPDPMPAKCCCRKNEIGEDEMECIRQFTNEPEDCNYLCDGTAENVFWMCNRCNCVDGKISDQCTLFPCPHGPEETPTCASQYDRSKCCCKEFKLPGGGTEQRLVCREPYS